MNSDRGEQETVQLLKEIVKWTRLQGISKAKEVLLETLKTEVEKLAYLASDGRGSQEVAKAAGISHTTVVNYWNKWATLGIVEALSVKGGTRFRAVFPLDEFGINVSKDSVAKASSAEIVDNSRTKARNRPIAQMEEA